MHKTGGKNIATIEVFDPKYRRWVWAAEGSHESMTELFLSEYSRFVNRATRLCNGTLVEREHWPERAMR